MPKTWVKPIVNSVFLPVHAQTSNADPVVRATVSGPVTQARVDDGPPIGAPDVDIIERSLFILSALDGEGGTAVTILVDSPFQAVPPTVAVRYGGGLNTNVNVLDETNIIVKTISIDIAYVP